MKINYDMLKKKYPCPRGIDWYNSFDPKDVDSVEKVASLALKSNDYETIKYIYWGICNFFSLDINIKTKIYVAEKVLSFFEKKIPNDNRPRLAIQMAKNFPINPTKEDYETALKIIKDCQSAGVAAITATFPDENAFKAASHIAGYCSFAISYNIHNPAYIHIIHFNGIRGGDCNDELLEPNKLENMIDIVTYGLNLFYENP